MSNNLNLKDSSLFDSQSLHAEMAVLNPNAISKTQKAMQFIHDNNIPGVIIGGIAVSNFTHDRALTPDVDFLTANIENVKSVLQKSKIPFQTLASTGPYGGIYVPDLDTDFLDANIGHSNLNHYILKNPTFAKIGGLNFPIINPAILTIMKFIIGREKDQVDAFKLLPTVPKEDLKIHLKALKNYLPEEIDAKTIWGYAQAFAT